LCPNAACTAPSSVNGSCAALGRGARIRTVTTIRQIEQSTIPEMQICKFGDTASVLLT
jgi:hypothetical protein